jgi:hypothetical protein
MATMRTAKERRRLEGPAPDYPPQLPELRRRIVVTDFDFGEETHVIELYRTGRIDCYRAVADGKPWRERIGWSAVLAGLRKSLPRIRAP